MTALQRALEPGAPAPGGGGEQISMIWARTRPWPAQFLCAPNRRSALAGKGCDTEKQECFDHDAMHEYGRPSIVIRRNDALLSA
jgi:hypothetical protein